MLVDLGNQTKLLLYGDLQQTRYSGMKMAPQTATEPAMIKGPESLSLTARDSFTHLVSRIRQGNISGCISLVAGSIRPIFCPRLQAISYPHDLTTLMKRTTPKLKKQQKRRGVLNRRFSGLSWWNRLYVLMSSMEFFLATWYAKRQVDFGTVPQITTDLNIQNGPRVGSQGSKHVTISTGDGRLEKSHL